MSKAIEVILRSCFHSKSSATRYCRMQLPSHRGLAAIQPTAILVRGTSLNTPILESSYLTPRIEVTIDEACGEAVLRGADIFAVGVYGAQGSIRKGHRVSVVIDLYKQFNKGHLNVIPDPEKKIYIGNGVAQMVQRARQSSNLSLNLAYAAGPIGLLQDAARSWYQDGRVYLCHAELEWLHAQRILSTESAVDACVTHTRRTSHRIASHHVAFGT